ncbi:MAG: FUSC family protein, partial [Jatrophihabitans sp.]|uniref:FUSC family protein n=1 Tax=Jatrophihabitans sp. TaxID=1932789 RepID=UPI003F7F8D02
MGASLGGLGGLGGLLRSGLRFDRSQSSALVAARNAIGVAAPLVIAVVSGSPASAGLACTIGALQTSFADRPGPYRLRLARMLTTAVAAAVTSGLAVLCSRSDVASVALLAALSFVAGVLLTGGPSATQVGVAGTAAALILGHFPEPAANALHVGLLVLLGGAGEAVLAVLAWPLGRHRPERVALARMFRELAALARAPLGTSVGPPNVAVLTDVRQTLYGLGHDHGPSVEAYRVLLDEGERIRRELLVLGASLERLDDDAALRAALTAAAGVLDAVATALDRGRPVDTAALETARPVIKAAVRAGEQAPGYRARSAAGRLQALGGQLRAVVETTAVGASEGRRTEARDWRAAAALRAPWATLRANLGPDSTVVRHAVRLAVLMAGSDAVMRATGSDRGYWVPLTVLVVLRPDFGTTFQRSVLRVGGTILGLLLATALVQVVPHTDWDEIVLIAVFCFGLRYAGAVNIGYVAVALSGLVVVLLEVEGIAAHTTALARAGATLLGGALALAAVLVRPSWERQFVRLRLADLIAAYRDHLAAVADPQTGEGRLQRTRTASRLARTNAQASLDRARAEPVPAEAEIELAAGVLAHSHRLIHAVLTLDALRPALAEATPPELAALLHDAGERLTALEATLRDGRPLPGSADPGALRRCQQRLADAVLADPSLTNEQKLERLGEDGGLAAEQREIDNTESELAQATADEDRLR